MLLEHLKLLCSLDFLLTTDLHVIEIKNVITRVTW